MAPLRWSVLLVTLFALVGCGGSSGDSQSSASQRQVPARGSEADAPRLEEVTHEDALAVVKQSDATLTVVNFWATWCVPCVEEFPSFMKLDRRLDDRGVEVMFISTDFPNQKQKVVEFLAEQGVTGTSYLKKSGNTTAFVNAFHEEWSGAVPATFVYDNTGTLLTFWEGKVSYEELKSRVTEHLDGA